MNELFAIPESKSPRLRWMEKHGIQVETRYIDGIERQVAFTTKTINRMVAQAGFGFTAEEACYDFAKRNHLLTWAEEAFMEGRT